MTFSQDAMKLPTYFELKNALQITTEQANFIKKSRETLKNILNFQDNRLLIIVGPCSIHDTISAKEFAQNLKELALEISDTCFLIMRTYCEKPRTSTGWKGFLYDPFLNDTAQIENGIVRTRQLLLDLAAIGVPTAVEFLDPLTANYYDDLVSWGSIGARTSSSQIHRQLASSLAMPIGFKNGIARNISSAIDGVLTASQPQVYIGVDNNGNKSILKSNGNTDIHIVLRGGESGPNYYAENIQVALEKLTSENLPMRVIVDCSHHNSNKRPLEQIPVFKNVLNQIIGGNTYIRGLMLESHLYLGHQSLVLEKHLLKYGVSITDPCLDWENTKILLKYAAEKLKQKKQNSNLVTLSQNLDYALNCDEMI